MSASLLSSFAWRRALKTFVPPSKLPKNAIPDISPILEAARLAPTSFGVQPFNIHVVTKQETKAKLYDVSYQQNQVTSCTHLLVFSARKDASVTVERFIAAHNLDNTHPVYATSVRNVLSSLDSSSFLAFSTSQAYIALGFSLAAAADLRIGSCPMGGFNADKVRTVLELPESEVPVAYLAIGIVPSPGSPESKLNDELFKVRLPTDTLITFDS